MKQLFVDLETAPFEAYIWRTGKQFVGHDMLRYSHRDGNIICACYKWRHEKKVHSIEWDEHGDKGLMEALTPILLEADELIAHNGDRFDMVYLNTRNLEHRLDPLPIWKTVDTLAIARKRFRFPSNRLDAICKMLFGEGKSKMCMQDWIDIKEKNCEKAMRKMVRYCKRDVKLLAEAYELMAPYHRPKTHVGVANGGAKWTCSHCGGTEMVKNKTRWTAAGTRQHQMICKACHRYSTISDRSFEDWKEYLAEESK